MSNDEKPFMNKQKPVLVIAGPTASGKTRTALLLAVRLDGEIVSADSMQIYRGMDIGTAKATAEEQNSVPHHLIDIIEPGQPYSVADYKSDATQAIQDIYSRGKWPILCGGTGQYLSAMIEGLVFGQRRPDPALRARLNDQAELEGNEALLEALRTVDPMTAQRLSVNDRKRIVRALEVYYQTGKTLAQQNVDSRQKGPDFSFKTYILSHDRQILYQRINQRVDDMIKQGLVEEVKTLMDRGLPTNSTCIQAIGYKELIPYIDNEIDLDQASCSIAQATRRYAKRQLTWFRKMTDATWLLNQTAEENLDLIQNSLKFRM